MIVKLSQFVFNEDFDRWEWKWIRNMDEPDFYLFMKNCNAMSFYEDAKKCINRGLTYDVDDMEGHEFRLSL